jgi:acetylornithine deacetylase/succinyl-diaminopimelate desuccinylase-like protein
VERSTGRPAVLIREGATIPVVADFKTLLGIDSLLIGFGLADDRIHSPNEKFNLDCFHLGCRTHSLLLAELGK